MLQGHVSYIVRQTGDTVSQIACVVWSLQAH